MIRQFGVNVIARQLAMGERRCYIVGCYLAPGDGATIRDVEVALSEWPRETDMIVAGDLNVDLERPGGRGRDEEITAVVATAGLEDLLEHFLPRRHPWCR